MARLHVALAAGPSLPVGLANSGCVFVRGAANRGATVDYAARISAMTVSGVD